jgi:hypothetical protein
MKLAKFAVLFAALAMVASTVQAVPVTFTTTGEQSRLGVPNGVNNFTWTVDPADDFQYGGATYHVAKLMLIKGAINHNAWDMTFTLPAGESMFNIAYRLTPSTYSDVYWPSTAQLKNNSIGRLPFFGNASYNYNMNQDSYMLLDNTWWDKVGTTANTADSLRASAAMVDPVTFFGNDPSDPLNTWDTLGVAHIAFTGNIVNLHMEVGNGLNDTNKSVTETTLNLIPDPATISLLVVGGIGVLLRRRRA